MSNIEEQTQNVWQALDAMYHRLIGGKDVSPGLHYRLEGKLQLLLDLGVVEFNEIQQACEKYLKIMGKDAPNTFWVNAQKEGVVRLPIYMVDAPVYKGR